MTYYLFELYSIYLKQQYKKRNHIIMHRNFIAVPNIKKYNYIVIQCCNFANKKLVNRR
jgi:hypothetical protein